MVIKEIYTLLLDKLNHLGSNFKQDIPAHKAMSALDQAQLFWYDERLKIVDSTKIVLGELQHLVDTKELITEKHTGYITASLPLEYYQFSNLLLYKTSCDLVFSSDLIEYGNLGSYLESDTTRPSLMWEQSFCTINNNKIDIYVDFIPDKVKFAYFKKLVSPDMETGYAHLDGSPTKDITLNFEGSSLYEIIEIAALILAGNFNDATKLQIRDKIIKEYK